MVHFPNFGAKTSLMENPSLSRTNSYQLLVSCQNLEKTNHTIPRKRPDRRTEERTKGLTEPIS